MCIDVIWGGIIYFAICQSYLLTTFSFDGCKCILKITGYTKLQKNGTRKVHLSTNNCSKFFLCVIKHLKLVLTVI